MADDETPQKPLPIADMQGLSAREMAIRRARRERLMAMHERHRQEKQLEKPSVVAGTKPISLEDARDLNARALGEILLKPRALRRFEKLLLSKEDRVSIQMFALAFNHILSTQKAPSNEAKPTQVIVNNLVARPGQAKDQTTVEVR